MSGCPTNKKQKTKSDTKEDQEGQKSNVVEKSHPKTNANANPNSGNMIRLSKNMEYILQQEALAKGIDTTLFKGNDFSHIIIKQVQEDEKMYLITMVKRVLHCCPYHDEENPSSH